MKIIEDVRLEIKRRKEELAALEEQLELVRDLPNLELSEVYHNGLAYGIAYETGHGDIEMLSDILYQSKEALLEANQFLEPNDFLNRRLLVVSLKPIEIVKVIK